MNKSRLVHVVLLLVDQSCIMGSLQFNNNMLQAVLHTDGGVR